MDRIGQVPRPDLFAEHKEALVEEGLVHLDQPLQYVRLVWQALPELIEPMPYRLLRELGQSHCLSHGDLSRPGPEDHPELSEG